MASPEDITITLTRTGTNKEVKMVLLGETGSGKTSFIDLVYNFMKFHSKDFHIEEIESITTKSDADLEGCATTCDCKPYRFKSNDVNLCIVDTPGLSNCERGIPVKIRSKIFLLLKLTSIAFA